MGSQLWDIGLAEGLGIFFFLFLGLSVISWKIINRFISRMESCEDRYLSTIAKLSETLSGHEDIITGVCDARADIAKLQQQFADLRKFLEDILFKARADTY